MTAPREQTFIPGTEPKPDPVRTPELDAQVDGVLEAEEAHRAAGLTKKLRHEVFLAELAVRGIDRYPYVDRVTGKKRYLGRKLTTTVAKTNAPRAPKKAPLTDAEKAERKATKADAEANRVESRRVPRETVKDEIGENDPFAATRKLMDAAT